MLKKTFLILFSVFAGINVHAQSADSVYNQYLDFNLARLQSDNDKMLELGENILPNAEKLPEKARINFYFAVGQLYENNNEPKKALTYYEKVAVAVPDYYVVHRALGYLYLANATETGKKLNGENTDIAENKRLAQLYEQQVRKALPHLEKAQACDPSDETLAIIKRLYKNIKDTAGLNSLDSRLKQLNKNCIDILSSQ